MQLPTEKEWRIADRIPDDIKSNLGDYSAIMQQLLYNRGITDAESAAMFVGKGVHAHDPFQLSGMQNAVERILLAIENQERIAVFGDYDADGITATALLTEVLQSFNANVISFLPEREDGYGVNTNAIDYLKQSGVEFIITVDCGIRSPEELKYAQDLGMTVIVTDHHVPAEIIPDVYSVINPKLAGDNYPEKNLAGVGVAYKVAQALFYAKTGSTKPADQWLELAAIGTVADVVPLLGENRLIVSEGLRYLRFTNRVGLSSLMKIAGLGQGKIGTFDISFGIAPRLNAAGRLDSPKKALELILTKDQLEAGLLSQELDDINRRRKNMTQDMQEFAQKDLDDDKLVIVAMGEDFNSGLVGLVAAKLTEFYYRPSMVGYIGKEFTRVSCRSIPEFHITHALDKCEHLLIRHGGHAMAAGFTVANENLEALIQEMQKIAKLELDSKTLRPMINIDLETPLNQLPENILTELDLLEPLGSGNSEAVFVSMGVEVKNARTVGRDESHLKLILRDKNAEYGAIAFNQGHWGKYNLEKIDVVYSVERNHYNGNIYKQLRVKDLKPAQ